MIRRKRRPVEKWGWMTTYSDMVTLLLCFFILMYAFSTIDNSKWEIIVKTLNPNAKLSSNLIRDIDISELPKLVDVSDSGMAGIETFDELYWQMKRYVKENNLENDIEVSGGEGYAFIVFRNNIFFDGDSSALKPEGRKILDVLGEGVSAVSGLVGEMRILGHTNQADPNKENAARGDRFLASNRATEVLVYLQEKNIIEPRKLVSIGYGQFYPVAPFVSEDDRLKNRRVEILITEASAADVSLEYIYSKANRENNI